MARHRIPDTDAWKAVTPASVAALDQRLWVRCVCGHAAIVKPIAFADQHGLDHATPLLRIGQALRCSRCGERKAHCWPKPCGSGDR